MKKTNSDTYKDVIKNRKNGNILDMNLNEIINFARTNKASVAEIVKPYLTTNLTTKRK